MSQSSEQVRASLSGLCTKLLEPETPEAATLLRVAELVGCFETDRLDADSLRVFVRCSQCLELETSGELALALGHTMARLSALAHGGARETFLHDGALGVLLRLAAHPLLAPAHAAATGLANLFAHALPGAAAAAAAAGLDHSANDHADWEFRRQLLEYEGGEVLRAVGRLAKRLAESEATEKAAGGATEEVDRTEVAATGPADAAPPAAPPPLAAGTRIEGAQRLGFGGKSSISTAATGGGTAGSSFCRTSALSDALAMVLMQLSQPPPQSASGGVGAVADGRRLITQRFCETGGLFALVRLCAHARPGGRGDVSARSRGKEQAQQAQQAQQAIGGLRALLACTMLHVAHLVPADAVLMGAAVDFAADTEPRVHSPAIGVLCRLATVETVRPLLKAGGALAALKRFKVSRAARRQPTLVARVSAAVRQCECE